MTASEVPTALFEVKSLSAGCSTGILSLGPLRFPCALGRSGRRRRKREGDGATPVGRWPIRHVFYRPDRTRRPRTALAVSPLKPDDGWCDDPRNGNYNRLVTLPYGARCEALWRDDHLYDLLVVLGYNDRPRVLGRGSAIFLHVAQSGYRPTEGCIALDRGHLLTVLKHLRSTDRLIIPG